MPDTGHRLVVATRDLFALSQDDFVRPWPYALSLPVSLSNLKPCVPGLGWGGEATRHLRAFLGHTLAMRVCPDPDNEEEEEVGPAPPAIFRRRNVRASVVRLGVLLGIGVVPRHPRSIRQADPLPDRMNELASCLNNISFEFR